MTRSSTITLGRCIARIRSGVSLAGENRVPQAGEIGILTLGAVSNGRFDADACKSLSESVASELGDPVRTGTLLMSRSNTIDLVGTTVFVEQDHPNRYLPDLLWEIEIRRDSPLRAEFLSDLLATSLGRRLLQSAAMGTSGSMKKLSMTRLRALAFPAVPPNLQRAWTALRQRLGTVVSVIENLMAAKREFKRGLMQELLTGRRRFPEFASSGQWCEFSVGELLQPVARPVTWDDNATYRLVSIRRRNRGLFSRGSALGSAIKSKSLFTVKVGDFLISRMQAVHGALGVVSPEFDGFQVSGMYMVLCPRPSAYISTDFLHYLSHLRAMYRNVLLSCHGVHIEKMTFDPRRFLRTKVLVPPTLEEQERITSVLRTLDREIDSLKGILEAYDAQKRGLMQKLLSSELTVPAGTTDDSEQHVA